MATAVGGPWAIPIGLAVGLAVGVVNGLGVAYLRVPSMIFTLGVNAVMRGLMVAHTGGFAPDTAATDLMRTLAAGHILGIPECAVRLARGLRDRRRHPAAHGARPLHLRARQQGVGGLSRGRQHQGRHRHLLRALRPDLRSRRRPSRRLFAEGLSGHGRRLSPARASPPSSSAAPTSSAAADATSARSSASS